MQQGSGKQAAVIDVYSQDQHDTHDTPDYDASQVNKPRLVKIVRRVSVLNPVPLALEFIRPAAE